jgi:hypothetical protein
MQPFRGTAQIPGLAGGISSKHREQHSWPSATSGANLARALRVLACPAAVARRGNLRLVSAGGERIIGRMRPTSQPSPALLELLIADEPDAPPGGWADEWIGRPAEPQPRWTPPPPPWSEIGAVEVDEAELASRRRRRDWRSRRRPGARPPAARTSSSCRSMRSPAPDADPTVNRSLSRTVRRRRSAASAVAATSSTTELAPTTSRPYGQLQIGPCWTLSIR